MLDHLYRDDIGVPEGLEADCWAIQLMVDGGLIRGRQLEELERTRSSVRGDDTHLSGEAHIRSLEECLRRRADPRAWVAALDTLVATAHDGFARRRGRLVDSTSTTPVHEALVKVPGTYDCEVVGGTVRCVMFAPRNSKRAAGRYRQVSRMLEGWLPPGWSCAEQVTHDAERRRVWIARDRQTHSLLTLTLARTQVYLQIKRLRVQ